MWDGVCDGGGWCREEEGDVAHENERIAIGKFKNLLRESGKVEQGMLS